MTKGMSLGLSLLVLAAASGPAAAFDDYVGRKRPMIVFAPNAEHPSFVLQRNVINGNRIGFSDRDLVVVYVIGSEVKTDFGAGPGLSAAAIRQRFRISEGQFRTFLVDKDGKLKLESATPLSRNDIVGELDRAPLTRDQRKRVGQPIGQ